MKPQDTSPPAGTETLAFEIDLRHPPGKVWRALTEPELMREWLLPVVGHRLEAGAAFRLQAEPKPGWDGRVDCEYLEIEPESRLRYRWVVGDLDTVVTLTLAPTDEGTRLSIVQTGFKPTQRRSLSGARYGWKAMGERLVAVLGELGGRP